MDKWLEQWMNELMNAWDEEEKEDSNEPIRDRDQGHGGLQSAWPRRIPAKEVSAWS